MRRRHRQAGRSQELLEDLERGNLFVVPLDDQREWYRYHHLFADVLQARALAERARPGRAPATGGRARGTSAHGAPPTRSATRSAARGLRARRGAARDERGPGRTGATQAAHVARLGEGAPGRGGPRPARARHGLRVGAARRGELEAAEPGCAMSSGGSTRGERADRCRGARWSSRDEARFRSLPGARRRARLPRAGARRRARHRRARAAGAGPRARGGRRRRGDAARAPGARLWASGDLEAAHRTFSDALAHHAAARAHRSTPSRHLRPRRHPGRAGSPPRGGARPTSGGLQLAAEQASPGAAGDGRAVPGAERAAPRAGRSRRRRRGHLQRSQGRRPSTTAHREPAALVHGDGAVSARRRATWTARSTCSTRRSARRPGPAPARAPDRGAEGARVDRAGQAGRGAELGARRGGCPPTTTSATCASSSTSRWPGCSSPGTRAVRDERALRDAARLLERLTHGGGGGRADGERHRDPGAAGARSAGARRCRAARSRPLERALTLAEPEGYVRVFVDEGRRMRDLLRHATARGLGGRVRAATAGGVRRADARRGAVARPRAPAAGGRTPARRRRADGAELEILRLIAAGLRNQEIADQLVDQPGHRQAAHRERVRQAGRRSPHRGARAGEGAEAAVAALPLAARPARVYTPRLHPRLHLSAEARRSRGSRSLPVVGTTTPRHAPETSMHDPPVPHRRRRSPHAAAAPCPRRPPTGRRAHAARAEGALGAPRAHRRPSCPPARSATRSSAAT